MKLVGPPGTARIRPSLHLRAYPGNAFAPPSQDPTRQSVAAGAHAAPGGIDSNLIGRTSIGLIVIIALILACGYLLKRLGPYRSQNSKSLSVVASHSVGHRERVVVVDVAEQRLVLGVTSNNIRKLHEMAAPQRPAATPERCPPASLSEAFAENLRQAKARFAARPRT